MPSLLAESKTLSYHSLESFILETIESELAYRVVELKEHPEFKTISQKILQLWKLFCTQTYKSCKQSQQTLSEKQKKSLRSLTILTLFQSKNSIQIKQLCEQLELDNLSLYYLLTEMNSKNLVKVKINEQTGVCLILAAKRRRGLNIQRDGLAAQCQARLSQILADNQQRIKDISLK